MTPRERRAFFLAAALLLVASLSRYGYELRRSRSLLPPDSVGIRDELMAETRRARAEVELRSRPLEEGERIDPNRASSAELDRLPGVGPTVADAIVSEREEGGWFTSVDDLERVRGIGPSTADRIVPWLDLSRPPPLTRGSRGGAGPGGAAAAGAAPAGFRPLTAARAPGADEKETVDVNRATAVELEALRGIGPALAGRIVELRGRKGRFREIDDLLQVRGIGPATLDGIRDRVRIRP